MLKKQHSYYELLHALTPLEAWTELFVASPYGRSIPTNPVFERQRLASGPYCRRVGVNACVVGQGRDPQLGP